MKPLMRPSLLAVLALCAAVATPASAAQPPDRGPTPGLGWGKGGSRGLPGPIAGAGLPFLLAAGAFGAYRLARRRREEARRPHEEDMGQG